MDARAVSQLGMGWVARRHTIEYLRPAFAGEELIVETHVADMKKVTSMPGLPDSPPGRRRNCWPRRRPTGRLLNYATGRPTRIPAEIARAFPVRDD